jgi:thiol-disulfide isomerase/thioredoxin
VNDPLRRTLERLEGPVMPDRAFADDLFERLVEEVGAPPGPVRRVRGRLRRTPEGLRRALVAAAALGLTAAVFLVTLPLLRPTEPPAIGEYGEMPPFRGIVEFTVAPELLERIGAEAYLTPGTHRIEVVYAGPDAWRLELLDDGLGSILPAVAGSFGAWDGERFRIYDAGQNAFGAQRIGSAGYTILNPLAWTATGQGWEERCLDREVVGSDVLLGREATIVDCGGGYTGIRLWLESRTGLVLRSEVAADAISPSFEGPVGPGPGGGFRFVELEFGGATPADAAFDPPPDAVGLSHVPFPPPTSLTIGEPVPALPTLEAAGLDLTPSNGRPTALYVWATWCPPCMGARLDVFDRESGVLASELNAFAISSYDDPDAAEELFDREGFDVTLLHDDIGDLESLWGVETIPTLVLLDGDGRLLGAYAANLHGLEVRLVMRAVAAGDPLPELEGTTVEQIP